MILVIMYYRIIILALLFFPCSGENDPPIFDSSPMEISDALPVQFWLIGCQTYNEHQAPGVHYSCFCQPWECDDEIKIQFTDTPGGSFSILIYDQDELLLDSIDMNEVSSGVYQLSFIPSETSPEVCDRLIQLRIQQNAGAQGVELPDLDEFANSGGTGDPWTLSATPSIATLFAGTTSEGLIADFAFIPGVQYTINVEFTNTNNTIGLFTVAVTDSSDNVQFSEAKSGANSGPNSSVPLVFTATSDTTRIRIFLVFSGAANTTTVTSIVASRSLGSDSIVAKSDCLDVRDHPESILLTYSNHRNFAGIKYEISSPEELFYIRIPAIFYHERFPEEDEVIELSSSLVTLNGTVRKQRRLDIDYVPYYFHEKIKLILKHQTLEINNRAWVKQEAYEIVEGDKRWPVKMARVWLSERDFVHRNIL